MDQGLQTATRQTEILRVGLVTLNKIRASGLRKISAFGDGHEAEEKEKYVPDELREKFIFFSVAKNNR